MFLFEHQTRSKNVAGLEYMSRFRDIGHSVRSSLDENSGFNRNNLFLVLFFVLPLLAYVVGSLSYSFFDLEGININEILSVIPSFLSFFELTEQVYGAVEGKRFFVIAVSFVVVFFIQNTMMVVLASIDGADLKVPFPSWRFREIASVIIMLIAFYTFFFVPSFTMTLTSGTAQAAHYSDFKFFLIAGLFLLFHVVPYKVGFALSRIISVIRKK